MSYHDNIKPLGVTYNSRPSFLQDFFFLTWAIFQVFIEFVNNNILVLCFGFLAARHVGS